MLPTQQGFYQIRSLLTCNSRFNYNHQKIDQGTLSKETLEGVCDFFSRLVQGKAVTELKELKDVITTLNASPTIRVLRGVAGKIEFLAKKVTSVSESHFKKAVSDTLRDVEWSLFHPIWNAIWYPSSLPDKAYGQLLALIIFVNETRWETRYHPEFNTLLCHIRMAQIDPDKYKFVELTYKHIHNTILPQLCGN